EIEHAAGAEGVQVQRQVQALVEDNDGGGVDDDLRFLGQAAVVVVADAEAFVGQIAGDDGDALIDIVVETLPEVALQAVEDAGLEEFGAEAVGGRDGAGAALSSADEQVEAADVGEAAEHLVEEGLAEEAGGAGDEDGFAGKVALNGAHAVLSMRSAPWEGGALAFVQEGCNNGKRPCTGQGLSTNRNPCSRLRR